MSKRKRLFSARMLMAVACVSWLINFTLPAWTGDGPGNTYGPFFALGCAVFVAIREQGDA